MTRVIGVGLTAAAGLPDLSDGGAILDRVEHAGGEFGEHSVYDQDFVLAGRIIRHRLDASNRTTSARSLRDTVHGTVFNIELKPRYWYEARSTVEDRSR